MKFQVPRAKFQGMMRHILFIAIFLASLGTWNLALGTYVAHGQGAPQIRTNDIQTGIIIPGERTTEAVEGTIKGAVRDMAEYVGVIYNFLISVVGVLAGIMLMIGGFQYLTSGGDASRAKKGKERIVNAIAGVVLALSSYLILNTINPQLVNLKVPEIGGVKTQTFLIPLCEDIAQGGVAVTQAGTATTCGKVGLYGQGNAQQVCMYRGTSCQLHELTGALKPEGVNQASFMRTCMPFPNVDQAQTLKNALAAPGKYETKIGTCNSCLEWAWSQQLGTLQESKCTAFETRANQGAAFTSSLWSNLKSKGQLVANYCRFNQNDNACYGMTFRCPTSSTATCKNYETFEAIVGGDARGGAVATGRGGGGIIGWFQSSNYGKLKGNPQALYDICSANPCNLNAANGGCKPSFGLAEISAYIRSNESGSWECENAGAQ